MRSQSVNRAARWALLLTTAACAALDPFNPTPHAAAPDRLLARVAATASAAEPGEDGIAAAATLDELIARARERHPSVIAALRRWEAALERGPQAGALPEPQLALTAWIMPAETRSGPMLARLMVSQPLPWPGRLSAAAAAADVAASAEAEPVRAALLQVEADARAAWIERVLLARSERIAAAHLELLRIIEAAARSRYAAGGADYAELLRMQVEIGRQADRCAELAQMRNPFASRLGAAFAGPPPDLDWAAQEWPFLPLPAPAELAALAHRQSPEARRARALARAAAADHERARLDAKPDFLLAAEYAFVGEDGVPGFEDRGADDIAITVGVDIAVRREAYAAAMRQALAEGAAAREEERAILLRLDADLAEHDFRLRDAERRVALYRDALLPKAEEAVGAARTSYEAGTVGFQDLLDATRVVLEFRLALERAHADRSLAWAELARLAALSLPVAHPQ